VETNQMTDGIVETCIAVKANSCMTNRGKITSVNLFVRRTFRWTYGVKGFRLARLQPGSSWPAWPGGTGVDV